MDPLHRPASLNSLVALSLDKLDEAENALRHTLLFAPDSDFNHSLIEADAFIRRAISTLKKALPTREE